MELAVEVAEQHSAWNGKASAPAMSKIFLEMQQ